MVKTIEMKKKNLNCLMEKTYNLEPGTEVLEFSFLHVAQHLS
jgi:hypothetical protein